MPKSAIVPAAILAGFLFSSCACGPPPGVIFVPVPPPLARAEAMTVVPGPGYIWIAGRWGWAEGRYVWRPGRWEKPPRRRAAWVPGHWKHSRHGWYWKEGHWR
jgi:WXXGXW repeat (2 copies)